VNEQRPTFVLMLRPLPNVDGIRGLRRALKSLLRQHKMQCVDLREVEEKVGQPTSSNTRTNIPPSVRELRRTNMTDTRSL
jgi:hypothetical protein